MEDRTHAKSMVALTALALLSEQPRHPYEIQRLMRERHKDHAAGKTRALYHAMVELEHAGHIEPVETSREGRRPERTVYRITAEGREELGNWLHDLLEKPVREWPVFSAAISLIAYLPQERAEAALTARTVGLRAAIAALEEVLEALQEQLRLPRIVLLELEHILTLQRAELAWVLSLSDDMRIGRLVWNEQLLREWFQEMHEAEEAVKEEAP